MKDLAAKIIELIESRSEIVHNPIRKGEIGPRYISANGNMKRSLGFKPRTTPEEGLRRTIKWYREHIDKFREIQLVK